MGFEEKDAIDALRVSRNDQDGAVSTVVYTGPCHQLYLVFYSYMNHCITVEFFRS